jgi:hypothetical protein
MKKLFFVCLTSILSLNVFAQSKAVIEKDVVDFYGVDFSAVNIVGADEPQSKFIEAFKGINNLLLSESEKFDVAKYLNVTCKLTNIDNALKQAENITEENFNNRNQGEFPLSKIADAYPETEGKVLVIVAKELNKGQNSGIFEALIFDGKSKQIIRQKEFTGKAGGFGLRNFWAGALYSGMKKIK